ncbi:MAG TPA: SIS domain-containing protein [Anaerolineaceae bacterium]
MEPQNNQPHYHMIDYIHEAPGALARTLQANEAAVLDLAAQVKTRGIQRIVISGVGSSYTAAVIAEPLFKRFSPVPVYVLPSTEIGAYTPGLVDAHTLIVAVSRSGERGWVVESFLEAVRRGALGAAVTGSPKGLLAQNAPQVLLTAEGPETTFPKTKSVVTCAGLLARFALALAAPGDAEAADALAELRQAPEALERILQACEPQVQALVPRLHHYHSMMLAGTLGNYGVALEGTLKMQEASGLVVIGNETGNMLHGPWGTITPDWLVTLLVTAYDRALSEVVLGLAGKIGARRLAFVEPGIDPSSRAEDVIALPVKASPLLAGLSFLPPIQLLTYYWAVEGGLDPDSPANMQAIYDAMLPPGRHEPEMG